MAEYKNEVIHRWRENLLPENFHLLERSHIDLLNLVCKCGWMSKISHSYPL